MTAGPPPAGPQLLLIDLSVSPPRLVTADDVIPAAILAKLDEIKELIMTDAAAEQQMINDAVSVMNTVAAHVSAAAAAFQQWVADNPHVDTSGLQAAMTSLGAADTTLQAALPVTPAAPLDAPVPDPGPPADTGATDTAGSTDTVSTDVPPDAPPPPDAPTPT